MHILVTNDDGYSAEGIKALIDVAGEFGDVTVVAPSRNYSGASSSLTLKNDITVHQLGDNNWRVDGTPTDCVHLALTGDFLPTRPDLIVSGINDGANMGDDTIYSGTVAAAIEGHLFDVPALAFSMAAQPARHFDCGALTVRRLLALWQQTPLDRQCLLNVNIPDIPPDQWRGFRQTRLGRRHAAEPAISRGKTDTHQTFIIGDAGAAKDAGDGTDFYAVENGYTSVTPLMIDLTADEQTEAIARWLP